MDPGDRRLVAGERGGLGPLPCPGIEIVGDQRGRGRQRHGGVLAAPQVEGVDVRGERAQRVGRGGGLKGGDQIVVDGDRLVGLEQRDRPGEIGASGAGRARARG